MPTEHKTTDAEPDYDGEALREMSARHVADDIERMRDAVRLGAVAQAWMRLGFLAGEAWRRAEMGETPDAR